MFVEFVALIVILGLIYYQTQYQHSKNFPKGPVGVPLLGYLPWLLPDVHIRIGKLAKKYGDIFSVKLGSETYVVINDFELIKEAMKMDVFAGRPNYLLAMSLFKNGMAFNQGKPWVEQRRFSVKTLRDFGFGKQSMETVIQESATDLIIYLKERIGKPLQINNILPIVAINCLWNMCAGDKLSLNDDKALRIFKIAKEGLLEKSVQGPLYVMPWLAKLFPEQTGYNSFLEAKEEVHKMLKEIIVEHQKTIVESEPRDYIDMYLIKMKDATQDSSFYKEQGVLNLVDGLINFFLAGGDTLGSTMDFNLLFLLKHPEVVQQMQEEIDRVIGKSRFPSRADQSSMPYVEAVMAETFRLSSIVPGAILHSTMEDVEFHGYSLPKNTIIYPNLYAVHHDVKYWSDPEVFRPERFLKSDGSFKKDERVVPFGMGKRECPAANIGNVEYFMFLTSLLQTFNIEPDSSQPLPPNDVKTGFVLAANSYKLIFKERH